MRKLILSFYLFLNSIPLFSQTKEMPPAPVVIYGEWLGTDSDTVEVMLWEYFIETHTEHAKAEIYPISLKKGGISQGLRSGFDKYFSFESASYSAPLVLTLKQGDRQLISEFLVFPGDSIMLRIDDEKKRLLFSGPSADLFRCQYEIGLAEATSLFEEDPIILTPNIEDFRRNQNLLSFGRNIRPIERGKQELMLTVNSMEQIPLDYLPVKVLDRFKSGIPATAYSILKGNIIGRYLYKPYFSYFHILASAKRSGNETFLNEALSYLPDLTNIWFTELDPNAVIWAPDFVRYLTIYARIQALASGMETYFIIRDCIPEMWQERVLAHYLISEKSDYNLHSGKLENLTELMTDQYVQKALNSFADLSVGKKLYPFEFESTDGKKQNPEDYLGKWLFLDFWYTGCGGCVMFYQNSLSKLEEHFQGHPEFEILSINTDSDKERWLKSLASGKYTSDLSVNLNSGGKDNPFLKHYDIRSYPYQLIIDPNGEIYKTGNLNLPGDELISLLSGILKSANQRDE